MTEGRGGTSGLGGVAHPASWGALSNSQFLTNKFISIMTRFVRNTTKWNRHSYEQISMEILYFSWSVTRELHFSWSVSHGPLLKSVTATLLRSVPFHFCFCHCDTSWNLQMKRSVVAVRVLQFPRQCRKCCSLCIFNHAWNGARVCIVRILTEPYAQLVDSCWRGGLLRCLDEKVCTNKKKLATAAKKNGVGAYINRYNRDS